MTRAIEQIKAAGERRLRKIHVPEWGLDIYCKTWTLDDSQKIKGLVNQDSPKTWAAIVQIKAVDANGEPLFTMSERDDLARTADVNILQRLATLIGTPIRAEATVDDPEVWESLPTLDELIEDARKNSNGTR